MNRTQMMEESTMTSDKLLGMLLRKSINDFKKWKSVQNLKM